MTLTAIPGRTGVFLDANILVYHFSPHAVYSADCSNLFSRIENGEVLGFTSSHIVSEMAHRLMAFEASMVFGWPSKAVDKLKHQPAALQQLTLFRRAVDEVLNSPLQVLLVQPPWLGVAAGISQQHGLLSNDAMAVAVMQQNGIVNLASNDADFDRVPWITRFAAA